MRASGQFTLFFNYLLSAFHVREQAMGIVATATTLGPITAGLLGMIIEPIFKP
jgi:hypothetical protein